MENYLSQMSEGLLVAATASKYFQGLPRSFYNLCNRCFEHLHVQALEIRIAMETYAQAIPLHCVADLVDEILINASLNVISRHCKEMEKR